MKNFFSERKIILTIVFLSILVRLLYLPIPIIINVADGAGYVAMANEALKGHWASFFDDYIYRTPIYPLFIAFIKLISGNFFAIALPWLQHLLGVIMAVLVYFIGKKVFDKTVGFLAGLLTGINAYQVYWEHNTMSDFFFAFMTVVSFYFFLKALMEDKRNDYIIFGILFGLNLLTRPLFQMFFVVFPVLIYIFNQNLKSTIRRFVLIMIPIIIIVSPWFFQNWYRHHYFGFTPFLGVQLMVRAQNYMDLESPLRTKEKKVYLQTMMDLGKCTQKTINNGTCGQVAVGGWADLQRKLGYSSTEANQALMEISLEAIKKNPTRYLKETVDQMQIFLTKYPRVNFWGDGDLDSAFREKYALNFAQKEPLTILHQNLNWKLTPNIIYFVILSFLGIIIALISRGKRSLPLVFAFLYILLITAAIEEGGISRYRLPLDPFVFLFATYGIVFTLRDFLFFNIKRVLWKK